MRSFPKEISKNNKLNLTFYLILVGSSFLAVFGTVSFFNGNDIYAVLYIGLVTGMSNLFLFMTKYKYITRFILVFIVCVIALALVITGGQEATGILWTYPLVMIAFAVLSMREGIVFGLIYLSLAAIFLFVPLGISFAVKYEAIVATRYLVSVLALFAMVLLFVHDQERANKQLKAQSVTDNLTGLFNRAVLNKRELSSIQSSTNRTNSFLMLIDIDHFKEINDSFGHAVGDEVLIVVAEILKMHVRSSDLAIRWGGEEFLLVLKSCPQDKTVIIAEKISDSFQSNNKLTELLGKSITLSIGISEVSEEDDFSKAVEVADENLYRAKQQGRNRVVSS